MKNISFLQLVLGIGGGLLIFSGLKDVDLPGFLHELATNPADAFKYAWSYKNTHATPNQPVPSGNTPVTKPSTGTQQI